MKINLLVQFLALIDELRGREEATAEFERLLTLCGFDYYGLLLAPRPVDEPSGLLLAGRWPEGWPELYLRRRYMQIDPTVRYLGHAQQGFRWRDTLGAFRTSPHRKRMERMMVDARNKGLEDGYVFPVHGRRGLIGSLSIGGRPVDLESVEIGLFDSIARRLYWKLVHADAACRRHDLARDRPHAWHFQPYRRLVHERHPGKTRRAQPPSRHRDRLPARTRVLAGPGP
jgi:LuxR family transcriptional regulator